MRRVTAKTKILQLNIALLGIRPPIWRRVEVPGDASLAELHEVVQLAMGWTDSHLHEFEIDQLRYGTPDPDWGFDEVLDETKTKLFRVVGEGDRLTYRYDFGDDWDHRITVEKILAPEPGVRYPRCVAGRRACPPEDVGGPWGYTEFLAAMADPAHDDHQHYRDWIGGSFDPTEFSAADADEAFDPVGWQPLTPARVRTIAGGRP